jgi:enoyl-CoA hydratase/carnithine racemase
MAYEQTLYDVTDRIATITLNRPDKLNAWTRKMEAEVRASMYAAEKDNNVRVILLTGAGRGFCAGADMHDLSAVAGGGASVSRTQWSADDGDRRAGIRADFRKRYSYFPSISKPIVAAINGPVAGLGFIMTLYCDLRIASDKAKFSTSFARRGLIAEHGISWLLPRLIGMANALDLLFSARAIEADEALRMGLVNRVVPLENFQAAVRAVAAELATLVSPRSLGIIKKLVYDAQFQTLAEAIEAADEEMLKSFDSEDFREGVAHFIEKRAPAFTGR